MSKKNIILLSVPDRGYIEEAPEIDADEFQKVITSRRAVRVFDNTPIPEEIVNQCLENALLAPNSSNLQPWELYWVNSKDNKSKLIKACLNQAAARNATELFVIIARTKTWRKHAREMLKLFNSETDDSAKAAILYYKKLVPIVYTQGILNLFGFIKRIIFNLRGLFYPMVREPVSKNGVKIWAVKSTALAAENLMLSFSAHGFDTCPMEGFDSKRIKRILNLPRDAIVVMVIAAGKRAANGIYSPRIRFDSSRFIKMV